MHSQLSCTYKGMPFIKRMPCMRVIMVLFFLTGSTKIFSQVTTIDIDLSGSKDTSVTITTNRNGNVCSGTNCVKFNITLNPGSDLLSLDVKNPAPPGNSAFYQVNCGSQTSLASPVCISGQTTVSVTFCKPGNDKPDYTITASSLVKGSADITLRQNCSGIMSVTGLQTSSIVWNSIYPGTAGQYNGYLSCNSNCSSTTVTPTTGAPSYIDYRVSGSTSCAGVRGDTIRVYTTAPLTASISPATAAICNGASVTLTASPSGGNPPYTYAWTTGSSVSTTSVSAVGTYSVTVSDNTTGCTPVTSSVTVTAAAIPAAPTVAGAVICAGQTTTLSPSAPGGTYQWYDAASGGNLLFTGSSFTTPALNTTTTYYVQTTLSGCPSARTAVTVTVNPVPAAPNVTGATICAGNTATVTASGSAGTYNWYDAATAGTNLSSTSSYTTPSLSATTNYYVETTVNGCTSARATVTATVNPIPAAPTIANATVCSGGTATLTPSAPGGTYTWYAVSSGGTPLATGSSYTTPTLTTSTTYYAEATIAGCTGPRSSVTVSIITLPVAPSVNAAAICTGTSASLAINNPDGGYTYQWYNVATGGSSIATGSTYTSNPLTSSTPFYVQASVSGCSSPSARTQVDVTVSSIPNAPAVNGTTTICAGNTVSLTASGSAGSYEWYNTASGGSAFNNTASYTSLALSASTSYYVATTVAGCSSARTPVNITVNPIPAAPAAAGASICSGSTATLQATSPGGSYDWYDAATAGTSLQNGTSSFTTPVLTSTTSYYVQTTVSGCTSSTRTQVTVTVNPIPAVPVINTATICAGNTATLAVTAPSGSYSYQWYDAATAGNLVTTGSSYTTPVLSGSTNYYVQATAGGCSSNRTTASVTVNPIPPAPSASGITICAGNTASLTASGSAGSYEWYDAATAGTKLSSATSYTTPVLNSSATYYVQALVLGCTSTTRTPVSVTVNPIPAAPTAAGASICSGSTATLQSTAPGGNYEWYAAASGGTALAAGVSSFTTPVLTSTTSYYVQTTLSGCTSSSRTQVIVTVNPIPAVPAVNTATICAGNTAALSVNAPAGGYTYQWYDAATAGNLVTTGSSYTTPVLSGNTIYYVQSVSGGCNSSRTTAAVNVTALPLAPTVAQAYICAGTTATLTATDPGGTYQWFDAAAGGNLLGTGINFTTPILNSTSQYYVQTTLSGCTGSRSAVTVTVNSLPVAPTVAGTTICAGTNTSLTATAPGGTYQWFDAATGGNLLYTGGTYITPQLAAATTYYVQTTVAGCTGSRSAVTINTTASPAAPTAANTAICAGSVATLAATAPGGNYEWYDAATGGNLLASGQAFISTALTANTIYYVQTTVNGCTGPRAPVTVTVNSIPAAPVASGSNTICAGNSITLSVSSSTGTVQWYDSASAGHLLATGNSFTTPVLNQNTQYYVQNSLAGCTSSRTTVTANVLPIIQPAFTYSSGTYCVTGSNPAPSIQGSLSGTFSAAPAGLVFSNTATGEINVAASKLGTYTIVFTVAGACTYTSSAKVTITNSPDASFVYNGPYCPQQLIAAPSFSGGASAGFFSSTNNGIVFLNNSTGEIDLKKSTPGTYSVTNAIAAAGGCAATSATNTVTINTPPIVNAGTDQTVCANTSILLNGSIGGTATSARWTGGAGTFSNAGLLNTGYTPAANESTVKLYLTTDDPSGPCAAAVDSMVIYINPLPAAPSVTAAAVCTGNNATLVAITPGGTYQWYDQASGGILLNTGSSWNTPVLTLTTSYYVQTTINGCTSQRTAATVTVSDRPSVTSPATGEICSANAFRYLLQSNQPGTSYTWARPSVTGISNPATTGVTDSTISEVLNNTTNGTVPVTYSIIPSNKGCTGDPFFYTASVKPTPAAPAINNNSPVCSGSALNLSTPSINGASYQWSGPNGFSSVVQNPSVSSITTAAAGLYKLSVTVNKCTSPATVKNIAPVIAAPSLSSNSPVCEQSTLLLTAAGLPGATYNWTGPAGFISGLQNPSIGSVKAVQAGTYFVTASYAGCTGLTDSVKVLVNIPPSQPAVTSNSPVCSSDSILLKTLNAFNNASFTWSGPNGFKSAVASPLIPNADKPNEGTYNVTVSVPGCSITSASSLAVVVNQKPSITSVKNNSPLCEGDSLVLSAGSAAGAAYTWQNTSGFLSSQQNTIVKTVTKANQGSYFVTAVLNGCLSDTGFTNVIIKTPALAKTGTIDAVCANNASVGLSGNITGEDTQTGRWTSNGTGRFLPSPDSLRAVYIPSAADTAKGNIVLSLRTTNNAVCPVSVDSTHLQITAAPVVNAGPDYFVCANDSLIQLQGTVWHAGSGVWTTSGSGRFQSSGSALVKTYVPSVSDIQKGMVQFYLTSSNNGNCIAVTDTLNYGIQKVPVVNAGNDQIIFENETIRLAPAVTGNDLRYLWSPSANLSSDTARNPLLTGKQNQTYTLRVTGTGDCTAQDQVFIRVLKPIGIPNIFTPNGDGIYDTWVIPELYNYPGAIVEVFTRSGMKVFSSQGYDKPWDGTFNGKPLPVATYYYIIKPNFRNLLFSGSVTIVR